MVVNPIIIKYSIAISLVLLFLGTVHSSSGQENSILGEYNPTNPTLAAKRIDLFFDTFFFQGGDRILATRAIFHYNFNGNRHMVSMDVPWLNTFYRNDFQGDERNQMV